MCTVSFHFLLVHLHENLTNNRNGKCSVSSVWGVNQNYCGSLNNALTQLILGKMPVKIDSTWSYLLLSGCSLSF